MAVTAQPFTGAFVADRSHSSVLFSVRHMKVSRFRASFADVDAHLAADEEGLRLAGRARVDSISIADPPELRKHVVSGQDFFDAGEHPEIRFRSSRLDFGDDGTVRVLGELAARLTISRGGMTKLVDRLEQGGLLRREPTPNDRRGAYAVLTAAGEATLKRMWPTYSAVLAEVVGPLRAAEANTLRRLLREVEARATAPPREAALPGAAGRRAAPRSRPPRRQATA